VTRHVKSLGLVSELQAKLRSFLSACLLVPSGIPVRMGTVLAKEKERERERDKEREREKERETERDR
jgi:hypothetical protein